MWWRRVITVVVFCGILALMNWATTSEDMQKLLAEESEPEQEESAGNTDVMQESTVTSEQDLWALTLVNDENMLDSDFTTDVIIMDNGYYFDARAAAYLEEMMAAMAAEGLSPKICSAYRNHQKQVELFQDKVKREMATGLEYEEAVESAKTEVAYPGTSEHELGLAVDIISETYTSLDESYENTAEAKWLKENCYKYGFILRYPRDKQDITKYVYEPWHFRYVGTDVAEEIMSAGWCLEEYLEQASFQTDN